MCFDQLRRLKLVILALFILFYFILFFILHLSFLFDFDTFVFGVAMTRCIESVLFTWHSLSELPEILLSPYIVLYESEL